MSKQIFLLCQLALVLIPASGCSMLPWQKAAPSDPPLKLVVAQIRMDAPLGAPDDLQSFDKLPSAEEAPALLVRLIEKVELKAQQLLTEQLAQQSGFNVIPFAEARQIRANLGFTQKDLDRTQLGMLGAQAGADIVLSGRILDYGKVQWQYWAMGLAISMLTETNSHCWSSDWI